MSRLWYRQPAQEWEEALPLGNGRIGAMVFGGVTGERIQVNEESIWYGGPVNRNNPDMKKHLPQIQEWILNGETGKAERLMKLVMSGKPHSMAPYQTLGDILLEFEHKSQTDCYERSLDIEEAIHLTRFKVNKTTFEREAFLSHPDDCLIMKISSDSPGSISFNAILDRSSLFDGIEKTGDNSICLHGNLGRGGYEFAMMLTAQAVGGQVQVLGETLCVESADEVILYFSADTTYHITKEKMKEELTNTIQAAMEQDYDKLRERHLQDYRSLYTKVQLELGDSENYDRIPTDILLSGASQGTADIGLSKLYFDYGRYLLIACSRAGGLPATLQGLWNKDMLPPWGCKFTININTQMNYWPAESCNLTECHLPLFDLIRKMVPNGRKTARDMYGCRGFVCHHNTNIHGDTAPQDLWIPGTYWVMGAAWLCTHLWTHYQYTLDKGFLEEYFPVMSEAALFFLDFLIEKDGYLMTCPSVSPENTFILGRLSSHGMLSSHSGGKCEENASSHGANDAGVTMDNQILRDLFTQCIEAAGILGFTASRENAGSSMEQTFADMGIDDIPAFIRQLEDARSRLLPTRIGPRGTILEWREDYEEWEPGHRHISHLYGLHPSEQITMDGTPELAAAARATLEYRLAHGGGHTGWSRAWIINHYAKLWDGETAYANLEQLFAISTYPNLFDKHPPFQIDGNFGGAAAIAEMLVQSTTSRILLLPALPKAWKRGSVRGLRIKGNGEIAVRWEEGKLTSCRITAYSPLNTLVKYGQHSTRITLAEGEIKDIAPELF